MYRTGTNDHSCAIARDCLKEILRDIFYGSMWTDFSFEAVVPTPTHPLESSLATLIPINSINKRPLNGVAGHPCYGLPFSQLSASYTPPSHVVHQRASVKEEQQCPAFICVHLRPGREYFCSHLSEQHKS